VPIPKPRGKWLSGMGIDGRLGLRLSGERACSSGMARRNDTVMLCDGHHPDQIEEIDQIDQIDQEPLAS